jgi:hypothetical protein
VTQVDALEEYCLLLVRSKQEVLAFPMDVFLFCYNGELTVAYGVVELLNGSLELAFYIKR